MIKLLRNQAECLKCGDQLASISKYDFKKCKCDDIFIDGGIDCPRFGGRDPLSLRDMSIVLHEEVDIDRAKGLLAILKAMNDIGRAESRFGIFAHVCRYGFVADDNEEDREYLGFLLAAELIVESCDGCFQLNCELVDFPKQKALN